MGHELVSNLEMINFFDEKGHTRIYDEAYESYVENVNPRRTQLSGKRGISGWKLNTKLAKEKNEWLN
jgi:hypothetical protein